MYTLIAQFFRNMQQPAAAPEEPARRLFEQAEARAGRNPRHARELRQAASAWFRVVR